MPHERRKKEKQRPEAALSSHAAVLTALKLVVGGNEENEMQLQLSVEFVLEEIGGAGIARDVTATPDTFAELHNLLAEAILSVELGGISQEQFAAVTESLLDSGALRVEPRRIRLEEVASAEEAATTAELFALKPGVAGMALLSLDDDWHNVIILEVRGSERLIVEIANGQVGAGANHMISSSDFRPEWDLECVDDEVAVCGLCLREMPLTYHHLIPKQEAHRYREKMSKEELARGVLVCRPCHSAIHKTFSNPLLASSYRTIERLLDESDATTLPLRRWTEFAARQRVSRSATQQRHATSRGGSSLQYGRGA